LVTKCGWDRALFPPQPQPWDLQHASLEYLQRECCPESAPLQFTLDFLLQHLKRKVTANLIILPTPNVASHQNAGIRILIKRLFHGRMQHAANDSSHGADGSPRGRRQEWLLLRWHSRQFGVAQKRQDVVGLVALGLEKLVIGRFDERRAHRWLLLCERFPRQFQDGRTDGVHPAFD